MELVIVREPTTVFKDGKGTHYYTKGRLFIDNVEFCQTLEPDDNLTPGTATNKIAPGKWGGNNFVHDPKHTTDHHYSAIKARDGDKFYLVNIKAYPTTKGTFNQPGGVRGGHRPPFKSDTEEERLWLDKIRKYSCELIDGKYNNNKKLYTPCLDGSPNNNDKLHGYSSILFHNGADYRNTEGCIVVAKKGSTWPVPEGTVDRFREEDIETWCELLKRIWEGGGKTTRPNIKLRIRYDDKGMQKIAANQAAEESNKKRPC